MVNPGLLMGAVVGTCITGSTLACKECCCQNRNKCHTTWFIIALSINFVGWLITGLLTPMNFNPEQGFGLGAIGQLIQTPSGIAIMVIWCLWCCGDKDGDDDDYDDVKKPFYPGMQQPGMPMAYPPMQPPMQPGMPAPGYGAPAPMAPMAPAPMAPMPMAPAPLAPMTVPTYGQ